MDNLFCLLRYSLLNRDSQPVNNSILDELDRKFSGLSAEKWDEILETAKKHNVLSLLCDTVEGLKCVPEYVVRRTEEYTRKICQVNYRLFIMTRLIIESLEREGIKSCVIKGIATAAEYRIPEVRKSGDIDILLADASKINAAVEVMEQLGFVKDEKQWTLHHVVMTKGKVIAEVHTRPAEPFDSDSINAYMESLMSDVKTHMREDEVFGISFRKLDDAYHAYELLLHMIQHFLNSGFGLKLLCDWVVFWNKERDSADCETYLKMINDSGVKKFSDTVTSVCIKYLGLNENNVGWMQLSDDARNGKQSAYTDEFMNEVIRSEEFGKNSSDRVVAVRGTGISAYFKELHHQMKNSFPRAGKCFLIWPLLWFITAFRFIRNNRKVRHVSTLKVLRSAKGRGKLVEQMELFNR